MKSVSKWLLILSCFASVVLAAEEQGVFAYPQTPQGRRIAAYFAAFNSMVEGPMAAFLQEHFSAVALARDSIDQRLARFRGFKEQARTLSPEKLLAETDESVRLLVREGRGQWSEFIFNFETGENPKITAIIAAPVNADDIAEMTGPAMSEAEALSRVRTYLDEVSKADRFSGVVLMAREGRVLLHEARGMASVEYGVPNRLDTRFNLGSINKLFTRVAIGQLVEKGALSLDDKIEKFLPDYPNPEAARQVTVRQLLDMTSGIGDFFNSKYAETPKDRIRSLEDYLPLFASEPLLFRPGSSRRYSNGGYIVLGLIVAKASGMSYFDYVRENICRPAGMAATGHLDADVVEANVAGGYTWSWDGQDHSGEPRRNNMYSRPARGSSAGGGYSTAADLLQFALALRSGKLLGKLAGEWFTGPQAYAGGALGINAELDMDPAPGWTVVVLGNIDPPAANDVARKIGVWLKRLAK